MQKNQKKKQKFSKKRDLQFCLQILLSNTKQKSLKTKIEKNRVLKYLQNNLFTNHTNFCTKIFKNSREN